MTTQLLTVFLLILLTDTQRATPSSNLYLEAFSSHRLSCSSLSSSSGISSVASLPQPALVSRRRGKRPVKPSECNKPTEPPHPPKESRRSTGGSTMDARSGFPILPSPSRGSGSREEFRKICPAHARAWVSRAAGNGGCAMRVWTGPFMRVGMWVRGAFMRSKPSPSSPSSSSGTTMG